MPWTSLSSAEGPESAAHLGIWQQLPGVATDSWLARITRSLIATLTLARFVTCGSVSTDAPIRCPDKSRSVQELSQVRVTGAVSLQEHPGR